MQAGAYSPFEPLSEDAFVSFDSMEGLVESPSRVRRPAQKPSIVPGYAIAGIIALVAYGIHYLPFPPFLVGTRRPVSASILAIVAAVFIRNLHSVPEKALAGCKHIVRNAIPVSIVLAGVGMNLAQVASVGSRALAITVICMACAALSAIVFGKWMGLHPKTALLIGTGTAVCGNSAIVAAAPLVEAEDEDVTLSVGTVSLLGLILMFALPVAGNLLGLSQQAFGVWAGTTIHAVPQVVAAGFTFGDEAGALATLVKLARVALLAPYLLVLTFLYRHKSSAGISIGKLMPNFIWGFLAFSIANTLGLLPVLVFQPAGMTETFSLKLGPWMTEAGNWLLTLAMAAVGLEVNIRLLLKVGSKALLCGLASMLVLCFSSWLLIRAVL